MEIGGDQHPTQRLPENVTAGACDLGLALGHQDDAKRPFTGGYVKTRRFRQTYGYFECAMRIAAEPGVNNAFWLVSDPASERDGVQYELDVAEAKYPDRVNLAVHRWKPGPKWADGHWFRARTPLSKRFHRYALLWTAETFVFFFDDREVWRCPNTLAHSPAEIRFSNAVAPFAGRHDGDVRGAATTIGWVRVFAPA
nr:glycoside hydrolase family 16 protein [Chthonobacter rhizosphaerae]